MRIISRIQIGFRRLLILLALAALGIFFYLQTNHFQNVLGQQVKAELERATGGRVEWEGFYFSLLTAQVHMRGLTLRSREEPSQALFHADTMLVSLRELPLLVGLVELDTVRVEKPRIHVVVDEQGRTNIPRPVQATDLRRSPLDPVFDLFIGRVEATGGDLEWNEHHQKFDFTADGVSASLLYDRARDRYSGALGVKRGGKRPEWNARVKLTIERRQLRIEELDFQTAVSKLTAKGTMKDYRNPVVEGEYQAAIDIAEAGMALGAPPLRGGTITLKGKAQAGPGPFTTKGEAKLSHATFYSFADITGSSPFEVTLGSQPKAVIEPMQVSLLGGQAKAKMRIEKLTSNPRFTLSGDVDGVSLTLLAQALEKIWTLIPLEHFRLAAALTGETNVQFGGEGPVEAAGKVAIAAPGAVPPGFLPVHGRADFHFSTDGDRLILRDTSLETPASRLSASGDGRFTFAAATTNPAEFAWIGTPPLKVLGRAEMQGTASGPLNSMTAEGRATLGPFSFRDRRFDGFTGGVTVSAHRFEVKDGRLQRGNTEAVITATLPLAQGGIQENAPFTASVELRRGDIADLQELAGEKYPVIGNVNASLTAAGTWKEPRAKGSIDVTAGEAYGEKFDRLRAGVTYENRRIEAQNIDATRGAGRVTGSLSYELDHETYRFHLTGSHLALDQISLVNVPWLGITGDADFDAAGSGSPHAGKGTLLVRNLAFHGEKVGNLTGDLHTDGDRLLFTLKTDSTSAKLEGSGHVRLVEPYPFEGKLAFTSFDFDSLLQPSLGENVTTHSQSDGTATFAGNLRKPESLDIAGDFSRLEIALRNVDLRNEGPVKARYQNGSLRIQQAHLTGKDTDITIAGSAALTGASRALALRVDGRVNLALLETARPGLTSSGEAKVAASLDGTVDNPLVNGRVELSDAILGTESFPNNLNHLNGTLLFNKTGLRIERLSGESGGGQVNLTGSIDYGKTPLTFGIRAEAKGVRMRYPPGVSTVLDARLNLEGGTKRSVLNGEITIVRAALNSNFDLAVALAEIKQASAAPASEPWAKTLELFVRVVSSSGIRFESSRTRNLQAEVDLRVRGTLADPALLGRVNILEGQVAFAGNNYSINRGEINFLNPFKIDPVVNLDVSTRKQQYDISLDFAGPLDKLRVNYHSDPPLPVNDIQTLLILGRAPTSAAAAASNPALTQATSDTILSQALGTSVNSRLERFFGASRLKIDPQAGGPATNPTARLTIEQQVAPDVTLTYITSLTSTQQQIVQMEWAVNQRVSILAVRDQNGLFGIDLRWKKRFR